ncbi:MAG TPA: hypothetical protein PK867_12910 [Pirellulales bacterium]|nr:hypothetical protein [Pirellulales bacterium]
MTPTSEYVPPERSFISRMHGARIPDMSDRPNTAVLDSLFDPVTACFTPDVARRIAGLRATPEAQARLDELADKCSEGTLTPEERSLYEAAVRAVNFIGVLQAKARAMLGNEVDRE